MYRKKGGKKEKNRDYASPNPFLDPDYQNLKSLYAKLKKKYGQQAPEILSYLEKEEILVPSCIFIKEISTFESIIKYLKENLGLANNRIALLTSKSQKSVWQAYNSTKRKYHPEFKIISSEFYLPISILQEHLTTLESVIKYLKESQMLSYHKIASVLNRNDRTIWTVYQRVHKKHDR